MRQAAVIARQGEETRSEQLLRIHRCGGTSCVADFDSGCPTARACLAAVAHRVSGEGCANNDGPAVKLVFKVLEDLPPAPEFTGAPLRKKELRVRVNSTLSKVRGLGQWKVTNPDTSDGLLAWVCRVGGYPCDFAVSGSVDFTNATDRAIDGHWHFVLQSGRRVDGAFLTLLSARDSKVHCR